MLGKRFAVGHRSHSRTVVLAALRRSRGLAMGLHSRRLNEAAAIGTHTDSAANQFGALASERRNPRGTSVVWPVSAARSLSDLWIGELMSIANTLPSELHGRIISSIINLVCPQCGGRMSEFQCEGRCCRNWLAEWEWANHVTRSSKSRVSGHRARSMR